MNRTINIIKDVNLIEKELNETPSGVLAFYSEEEKVIQEATNFLYKDKNIFIFFAENDELFEKIRLNTFVSFTILRNTKKEKSKKPQNNIESYLISVTINGIIKLVDDKKLINSLQTQYTVKYHPGSKQEKIDFVPIERILLIDSEEIQAFEEIGN